MPVKINVNGDDHTIDADPDMPLLWAVRDHVRLTGTKFGCGMALCGACTVHADGEAIRSCVTPVSAVAGQRITTIEGLHPEGAHALQEAWRDIDVPQCGYCQPGQLMSAAALLAKHPKPTDEQIDREMSGNVCRCGTYNRIRQAIHQAAAAGAKPKKRELEKEGEA